MRCYLFLSIVLALLVAAWGTGCGSERASIVSSDEPATAQVQGGDRGEATPAPTVEPQSEEGMAATTPAPQATEVKLPARAEQVVALAREDLAQRLGLAPEAIRLASVEAVEWSDTSLGCSQPGMMYAQVITPGFRAVMSMGEEIYEYHSGGGPLVLCSDDGQPYIRVRPTVFPGEEDAEFDEEKLMEVERLIREKESLGYDVQAARVYLATAQWMKLQEKPAQANLYLDLALEALQEAQKAGKIPSEELRRTVVPLPTFVPEQEFRQGD
mgnify:CR=1 FL=1